MSHTATLLHYYTTTLHYMFLHYQDWSLFQINPAYISLVDPRAPNVY